MNLAKKQVFIELPKKQVSIEVDEDGNKWVVCPHCNKKAIQVLPETKISMLPYVCKNNKCPKKKFVINYNSKLRLI